MNEQTKQVGMEKTEWVRLTPDSETDEKMAKKVRRVTDPYYPYDWELNSRGLSDAELDALAAHAPAVKALVTSLHGMIESYNILMKSLSGIAKGVVQGAFIGEIDRAVENLAPFEEADDES